MKVEFMLNQEEQLLRQLLLALLGCSMIFSSFSFQQLILNLWKGEIRQRSCDWFWVHYKMVKKMSNTRSVECSVVPSPKRSPVCWNNGLQTHACEYSHSNSGFLKALLVHILFFFFKNQQIMSPRWSLNVWALLMRRILDTQKDNWIAI